MASAVVLASGSGSNFEAIARSVANSPHEIAALITDKPGSKAQERADRLRIESRRIAYASGRRQAEEQLVKLMAEFDPDLIVLAGFMRILSPGFVEAFKGRIINIHPSILPAFPGLAAIERSFADPAARMGITIHYVDAGVDTGPIIEQHEIDRATVSDIESAQRAIHEIEHQFYPEVVMRLLNDCAAKNTRER